MSSPKIVKTHEIMRIFKYISIKLTNFSSVRFLFLGSLDGSAGLPIRLKFKTFSTMVKITSFRFLKESLDALMAFTAKA